ncbi:hypothetical protein Acy02nite_56940 [Actinoplanes cyaneus]|uniref:Uncharacterized protein n=1 Tax=Actinoplanes cyaneus TaxID=52696 RepID=A0A919IQQ9_9ACTN|nr:hypothetical protein [Actinoplanes cyaneus]MCW2139893.1 hypothetical protein [Actinoplanes cyaneus]GID67813.1 hypothetical protein Acy02nite_56940 [Actinoplanes cyaneus]
MLHRPVRLLFAFAFIVMCFGLGLIFDGDVVTGLAVTIPAAALTAGMVTVFFRNRSDVFTDWQTSPLPGQVPTAQDQLGGKLAGAYSLLPFAAAGALLFAAWTHGPDGTGARIIVMLFVLVFAGVPALLGFGLLKAAVMWYYGNPLGRVGVKRLSWFIAIPAALMVLGGLTDSDSHASLAWSLPLLVVTGALMYQARLSETDRATLLTMQQAEQAQVNEVFEQLAAERERQSQQQGHQQP